MVSLLTALDVKEKILYQSGLEKDIEKQNVAFLKGIREFEESLDIPEKHEVIDVDKDQTGAVILGLIAEGFNTKTGISKEIKKRDLKLTKKVIESTLKDLLDGESIQQKKKVILH